MFGAGFVSGDEVAAPSDYGCIQAMDRMAWVAERLDNLAQLISDESGGLFRAGPGAAGEVSVSSHQSAPVR